MSRQCRSRNAVGARVTPVSCSRVEWHSLTALWALLANQKQAPEVEEESGADGGRGCLCPGLSSCKNEALRWRREVAWFFLLLPYTIWPNGDQVLITTMVLDLSFFCPIRVGACESGWKVTDIYSRKV